MITYKRTDSEDADFLTLVKELDAYLVSRYGAQQTFFDQFNKLDMIQHVIVVYEGANPVGCGAIKAFEENSMEIKRMFVRPEHRGKSIASGILHELEKWTLELGYAICVLETGDNQPEAVHLYKKNKYKVIPNYGPYAGVENSICFRKELIQA